MTASRLSRRAALGLGAGLSVSCFGLGAAAAGVTDRKLVVIVLLGRQRIHAIVMFVPRRIARLFGKEPAALPNGGAS